MRTTKGSLVFQRASAAPCGVPCQTELSGSLIFGSVDRFGVNGDPGVFCLVLCMTMLLQTIA